MRRDSFLGDRSGLSGESFQITWFVDCPCHISRGRLVCSATVNFRDMRRIPGPGRDLHFYVDPL